jgi:hypothetical protein
MHPRLIQALSVLTWFVLGLGLLYALVFTVHWMWNHS